MSKFQERYNIACNAANEYIQKGHMQQSPRDFEAIKRNLEENIKNCIEKDDFIGACYHLDCLYDAGRGIYRETVADGKVEIRDGSEAIDIDKQQIGSAPACIQILKGMMAAIDICNLEISHKFSGNELINNIKYYAKKVVNKIVQSGDNLSVKELHQIAEEARANMIKELEIKGGVFDATKKFNIALQYQNYNDEHRDIVHISNIGTKENPVKVAEILVGFNEKIDTNSKHWFSALSDFERKMYHKYEGKMQNNVKPTQLRNIPGISNAFCHLVRIYDAEGKNPQNVVEINHAGTLVSLSPDKKAREEISEINHKQLIEYANLKGKPMHVNTLVNPITDKMEKEIVDISSKYSKNNGIKYANTSINVFRVFGGNETKAIRENINEVIKIVQDAKSKAAANKDKDEEAAKAAKVLKNTENYLQKENNPLKIILSVIPIISLILKYISDKKAARLATALDNIAIDPDTKSILQAAVKTQKSLDSVQYGTFIDNLKHNHNLTLAKDNIDLAIKQGNEVLITCKSGKDRTGQYVHTFVTERIQEFCEQNKLKVKRDDISAKMGRTDTMGYMAGGMVAGGGSPGSYGLKPLLLSIQPKDRAVVENIVRTTAKSNRISPKTVKKAQGLTKGNELNMPKKLGRGH